MINLELQASAVIHGDSYEKWIKEKSLDISTGPRAEDAGPQENPRWPNRQEVEEDRGSNAPKSIQSRIITRQPGVTGFSKCLGEAPRQRGAFSFRDIIGLRAG